MFQPKEKLLLCYLIKHRETFVTSRDIADYLECSDRTVRTYYKTLATVLATYQGIDLIAKQGKGYCLTVSDYHQFQIFLEDVQLENCQLDDARLAIDERQSYILNKLLFDQNDIYFDDLVDEFFVSRSTLSNDFKKIRQQLEPYELWVESKANKGVYISGTERNKRRFIMDYFLGNTFVNSLYQYVDSQFFHEKITFEELMLIVLEECRKGGVTLSDFVLQNLVIHIALALRRISEGFNISKLDRIEVLKDCHSCAIAEQILKRVSTITDIKIPPEEVDYITLHLVSKGNGSEDEERGVVDFEQQVRKELQEAIAKHGGELALSFQQDFQLIEGLLAHLKTLRIRLENKVFLENPLLADIKKDYQTSLDLSRQVMQALPYFQAYTLSDDELAYIALHFLASRERVQEESKRRYRILVICATGYSSAQLLRSRIEKEMGDVLTIVNVIGYYDLNDQVLENIDFIIATIDLSELIFTIPVYTVSVFFKEEEVQMIQQAIKELGGRRARQTLLKNTSYQQCEEVFNEYISPDYFFVHHQIEKTALLEELVAALADQEDEHYTATMQKWITQRESMSSVVFSEHIAVPHPIQPLGHHHRMAVAIVKEGLYWSSDYPAVKLVFLPSLSVYGNEGLEHLTASIVELVDKPEIQEELINCSSFDDFKKIFLSIGES
ncbi:BglG family transcription antiterminator [Streptococcus acidominimus]|uniref:Lichenan operon transcriptional antiterminator n=1 Tax=Streptococcus acidominimus TaxID=1326 RepID=A0A1Q8EG86_STRAI|nr:PRD domain-containing protein [Streptococcus acidominimus]OLF50820.1 transcription antiterminator BglG [Streptococcus acidominimus]SUN07939.1 lichenan operon transcriptional antiterminator [Streptococcus acidominimus]